MINQNDLYDVIWEILDGHTENITWIRADQPGYQPLSEAFGTFRLGSFESIFALPHKTIETIEDVTYQVVQQLYNIPVELNIFSDTALTQMSRLKTVSRSEPFRFNLYDLAKAKNFELIWVDNSNVTNLSALIQTSFRERGQMDVTLRLAARELIAIDDVDTDQITIVEELEK